MTVGGTQLDRGERRDGRTAHTDAEDAERRAAALGREPGIDQRNPNGERGAAQPEEEPAEQQKGVAVGDQPDEQDRDDREHGDRREHCSSPKAVGQGSDRYASQ